MTSAARPVARLTSPGEIVAVVPALCGFVPQESLVVVSLRGPRKRVGLTMRFDLDWAAVDPLAAADEVAGRLELDGAAKAVLVVFSGVDGPASGAGLSWSGLVEQVSAACESRGVAVDEALLVRDGRWWSYVCSAEACCPSTGTPLTDAATPALRLVEAERVLEGRVVLPSRAELVESIAPPSLLAAVACEQELERAVDTWLCQYLRHGREWLREQGTGAARALLSRVQAGEAVSAADAARLAVAVQDVLVRDEVATWCLTDHDALLSMLLQTARQVVPPEDAAVTGLLAWVAYAHGDGGLANVALDRCLTSEPGYTLGHLLAEMLARQVPPSEVRELLAASQERRHR